MNGYMTDTAAEAKRALLAVPQAKEVVIKVSGIVGGDFTVVATKNGSTFRSTEEAEMTVKVKRT